MKHFYLVAIFIAFFLSNSILKSQGLDWIEPLPTGTGNASIAVIADPPAVLLNGETVTTIGALIGIFYENDSNNLICAGYSELDQNYIDGGNINIAGWGTDAGEDNGLESGEIMNFYLNLDGVDYPANSITIMDMFGEPIDPNFEANGLYVVSEINFGEAQIELDPCSCIDGSTGTIFGSYCILSNNYCPDPAADNYCNTDGYDVLGGVEDCIYGAIEGCTCPSADNYNPVANADDGSCYISEGCSNPLADNYSLSGCDGNVSITNENCILLGCTCPEALNYDPTATVNDGSCAAIVSLCTDPTAGNFNEGCENTEIFGAVENCEYGGCELENIVWDYEITDANMTIQVSSDVVTLNGDSPPIGSLLGVFFTNDEGQLACAGYQPWTGDQLAIAAWGAESGFDNGFQAGEEFTWLLYVGNQTFTAINTSMNGSGPFSEIFVANGFGQLTSVNYECEIIGVFGCTDSTAYNYNSDATIDDGSCYNLDWSFTITSSNMTILINSTQINAGNITLNGEEIPNGAQIGIFYENDAGQLMCAGMLAEPWSNTSNSIAAWESETGEDNGFQAGDQINTFFLLIGDQVIPMDENGATMSNTPPFSDTFAGNGFGEVLSVNFEGEYTISYGCTDASACNYDASAIVDDESCDYGQTWYQDSDGDGLGNPEISTVSCNEISGFVTNDEDPCPDNINNPNNSVIWYLDEDGDGLGTGYIYTAYGCDAPGPDFSDVDGDPCPYTALNDSDEDGICDDIDDCIGTWDAVGVCNGDCTADNDNDGVCDDIDECVGAYDDCGVCNGPGQIYECGCNDIPEGDCDCDGNTVDVLDICGGDCTADDDSDGICDDVDECVGAYDDCGICNGPGQIYECGCNDIPEGDCDCDGNTVDVLGVCGGDCTADDDNDGICDDVDDCVGDYDAVGVCNGECTSDSDSDGVCDTDEIAGCQDEIACNYNPDATDACETSCCTYAPEGETCAGCTDPTACNYNAGSTIDDGSCILPDGCTDEDACNYNPDALCDNGSCILPTTWYLDDDGDGLGFDSGIWGFPFSFDSCDDWSDGYADNADDPNEGDFDNDFVFTIDDCDDTDVEIGAPNYGYDCDGNCVNDDDSDGICNEFEIGGCTDTNACNYNESATDEDGSCDYAVEFYDCDFVCLNDSDGDGVCDELEIPGCTNTNACNYNTIATDDDGSCLYLDGICETCENGEIIDNDTDNDQVCDDDEIPGCTDTNACNYESIATDEDGSCLYLDGICETCENGEIIDNDIDNDQVCDDDEIPGCTDTNACNYETIATDDDGSCLYLDGICETCENGEIIDNDIDNDQVCDDDEIPGCTDTNACNYETIATDDNGSCLYLDGICETCENGEIIDNDIDNDQVCDDDEIPGCTDPNACNFDPNLGCTDDDGSCFYSEITVEYMVMPTSCEVECNGEIQLVIANGQPPYVVEYTLVDEDGNVTNTTGGNLPNACYGSYAVIVTDAYNCESDMLFIYVDALDPDTDQDGVCDSDEILGCTDDTACNYNSSSTEEDNSCYYCYDQNNDGIGDCGMYPIEFFDCDGECWNDSDFDGICDELEVVGCDDLEACNYSMNVSESCEDVDMDGIPDCCTYPILYYLDCDENCLNDTDGDGVCDEIEIVGCQDDTACNYDASATDAGNCIFPEEFYDCEGCINDTDGDGVCDELEVLGCQDGLACNFDPEATDPDECFYLELSTFVDENIQNVTCPGDADGSFIIYTTGGNAPYTLFIDGFSGTTPLELTSEDGIFTVSGASGGSYDVVISDVNFCETLETVSVEESSPIDITIDYLDFISCTGGNDGSLTNSIQGGIPPYSFEWLDAAGNVISTEQDIFNLSAGAYALEVTDDVGCSNEAAFILGEPNVLEIDQLNITDVSCFDGDDGSVEVFIIGGASPFTYSFTDLFGNNVNPNTLSEGNYIITITDDNGCIIADNFSVDQPNNPLTVSINASETEICENEMVEITATNGFDNYIWMETIDGTIFGNNTNVLEINESGEYMVTAFDQDGCEASSETIEITVYQNPIFDINGVLEVVTGNTYTYYTEDNNNDYIWSIQPSEMGTIESGENESVVEITWLLEGTAEIYLTQIDENECSSTESVELNITWPVALNELSEEMDFIVFPNPFNNYTNIHINNPNKTSYNLYLYDIKGTLIKSFINQTTEKLKLEKEFSNGIYHLQLISSEGNKRKLIIVE